MDESPIYQTETTGGAAAVTGGGGQSSGGGSGGSAGPSFQFDSDGIRTQADALAQCAQQAASVLTNLRNSLISGGEPWGTDDMAKKFGHSYTGSANQGFTSLAGLPAALANVAGALAAQADQWYQVDGQISSTLNGIGGPSGSAGPTEAPTGQEA